MQSGGSVLPPPAGSQAAETSGCGGWGLAGSVEAEAMCAGTCLYWAWGSPGRMGFWRAELPHPARRVSCQLMGVDMAEPGLQAFQPGCSDAPSPHAPHKTEYPPTLGLRPAPQREGGLLGPLSWQSLNLAPRPVHWGRLHYSPPGAGRHWTELPHPEPTPGPSAHSRPREPRPAVPEAGLPHSET